MYKRRAWLQILLVWLLVSMPLYSQTWETYTCKNDVQDLCCVGDYCWVATTGGVVKVNINDFSFEEFEREEGLASNNIKAVAVDSNKNLWIGTNQNGITVFNGLTPLYYDVYTNNLTYANVINCIFTDSDHKIWIGTWGGTFVFNGQNKILYDKNNSKIISNYIYTIKTDNSKKIWFGTDWGVSVFDGVNWQSFTPSNSELQCKLICDLDFEKNNKLWLAANGAGVYSYENNKFLNYNTSNSDLLDNNIISAFVDTKNNKWFGSNYGRVYCYNDTTWCWYDSTNSILPFDSTFTEREISKPCAKINAIVEDKNGNLWCGTSNGLYLFDGAQWRQINISPKLQSNYVSAITIDEDDNAWLATNNGVTVVKSDSILNFNVSNSTLEFNVVQHIAIDSSGRVWASKTNMGISVYKNGIWTFYDKFNSSLPDNLISYIAAEDSNKVWFGTSNKGIIEYSNNEFILNEGPERILNSTAILAIGIDKLKNKWICTSDINMGYGRGLFRYDDLNWVNFNTSNCNIASQNVEAIAIEDNGAIWAGTTKGVSCYDGLTWTTYNTSNSGLLDDYVTAIAIDKKGRKWFYSYDKGLSVFDGANWTIYTPDNSLLASKYISAIAVNNKGDVLIGTSEGLSIFRETGTSIKQQSQKQIPTHAVLSQNYPNPFNSSTEINYLVMQKGYIKLLVYNLQGQIVKTLYSGYTQPGEYAINWNGLDDTGVSVVSGIYFYRLTMDRKQTQTRRLVFLK